MAGAPARDPLLDLTPKQRAVVDAVFRAGKPHCLLFGGGRSGKTWLTCFVIVWRALIAPGSQHLIIRKQLKDVRASVFMYTLPNMMDRHFPGLRERCAVNKSELSYRLPNGSVILFGGLDDKTRSDSLLGSEYATIYANECSEVSFSMVEKLRTRAAQGVLIDAPGTPDHGRQLPQRMYYDLNPSGVAHWSYQEWFLGTSPSGGTIDRDDYVWAQINPTDNPTLPEQTIKAYRALGGAMRKRFLDGEYLAEVPGALWTQSDLDIGRVSGMGPTDMERLIVSVDPSFNTGSASADMVGLCLLGRRMGHAYLLRDETQPLALADWPTRVVDLYHDERCDFVVVEDAFGQLEIVTQLIRSVPPTTKRPGGEAVPIRGSRASRGKYLRAEPVRGLFTPTDDFPTGRVHLVGHHPQVETECTTWLPGSKSPNALDAMVHGVSVLMDDLLGVAEPAGHVVTGTTGETRSYGLTRHTMTGL